METAIAKTESQGQLALTNHSLPAAFSRLLETASHPKTFLNPETTRRALLCIGDECAVRAWIDEAIRGPEPASMRDFVLHLSRLSLHYWRPDFTPEQAKLMFQDFANDLASVTATELEQACREYRSNPKNQFFPTPGKLLALVQDSLGRRASDKYAAQRLLNVLDGKSEPERRSGHLPTAAEILAKHYQKISETEPKSQEPVTT